MLKLLALTILLLFPIGVWAQQKQEPTLAPPYDAICTVINQVGREMPTASGTLVRVVDGKGYILTCDHLWHRTKPTGRGNEETYAGRHSNRNALATFPDGHESKGRLLQYNAEMDVSLVEIYQSPPNVEPAKLVILKPDEGPFTLIGYPHEGEGMLRWRQGLFSRWRTPNNARIKLRSVSGFSGGLLANKHGEGVGVASGNDLETGESIYGAGPELISFVERSVPK